MTSNKKLSNAAPERRLTATAGRAIVAACLIASFVIPYLAVAAFQAYNYRQWTASGLNLSEIDEWRDQGFIDVNKAIRWKAAGFKPPGAVIWRDEGFGPEEAGEWKTAGVSPAGAAARKKKGERP